jgi:hypothetical protein
LAGIETVKLKELFLLLRLSALTVGVARQVLEVMHVAAVRPFRMAARGRGPNPWLKSTPEFR